MEWTQAYMISSFKNGGGTKGEKSRGTGVISSIRQLCVRIIRNQIEDSI